MTVTHAHPRSNCCSPIRARNSAASPLPKIIGDRHKQAGSQGGTAHDSRVPVWCVWLRYSSVSLPCLLFIIILS